MPLKIGIANLFTTSSIISPNNLTTFKKSWYRICELPDLKYTNSKMKISKIALAKEAFKHKGFILKIPVIIRMVKSIMSKNGYKPEFKNVILPALVIVYLISPLDIIPDWIPLIGVLDDLALLALAMPMLISEAEKFVAWEESLKSDPKILEAEIVR